MSFSFGGGHFAIDNRDFNLGEEDGLLKYNKSYQPFIVTIGPVDDDAT